METQHNVDIPRFSYDEKENKLFNLYFDRETYERMKKKASRKNVSLMACILELSRKYCEGREAVSK